MSTSGVQLNDEALTAFNEFKLGNKKGNTNYIIYRLSDNNAEIIVEKKGRVDSYDEFVELLPENDCRYAVYDFEFELANGEGKRNKIVFYQWSPDTAKIKPKMVYASSKEAIRRALTGVAADIQGTDYSEVDYETVLERVSRGASLR